MLRHAGQKRSFKQNLRLAIMLCINAGFINAAGFLAFNVLTTNVTGHAALLAVDIASMNLRSARMVVLWLILFLLGAFTSSFIISRVGRNRFYGYATPMIVIILIVLMVALFGKNYQYTLSETEVFAGSLLFGMGMQNAMVSMISGAVVRTTHLTGMFTDLGIDLATLFRQHQEQSSALKRRIVLKLAIIISFLLGGILGALLFNSVSFTAFFIPALILVLAMCYDFFRIKISRWANRYWRKRSIKH
ncbi:YoaK family protein [Olivibacter ginsenosidimutans]|uniref:YoaK family protein n=1 Tax=Olivibacter ginsenosidimutans TaxID=1176537 RepID=A0ABP9CF99_9SPHI